MREIADRVPDPTARIFGTTIDLSRLSRYDTVLITRLHIYMTPKCCSNKEPRFFFYSTWRERYITSSLFTVAVLVKRLKYSLDFFFTSKCTAIYRNLKEGSVIARRRT